jgi:hypothetical protein
MESILARCAYDHPVHLVLRSTRHSWAHQFQSYIQAPEGRQRTERANRFQFQAGESHFPLGDLSVLVVAARGRSTRGTGVINGAGNYSFILTAIDG